MFDNRQYLSSDLEWMLQSTQAENSMILEAVAREYGFWIGWLSLSLLNDRRLAEEAVQKTFTAILKYRYRYSGNSSLQAWISSQTLAVCLRIRRGWLPRRVKKSVRSLGIRSSSPEAGLKIPQEETELDRQVWSALDRLGEGPRSLLILHYVHQVSDMDIAQITGRRQENVQPALHAARQQLYGRLQRRPRKLRRNEASSSAGSQSTAIGPSELDALLARSLPARCPPPNRTDFEPESLLPLLESWVGRQRKQSQILRSVQQLAFGGAILIIILLIGLLNNHFFPQTAAPARIEKVRATQLVKVPVAAALTPTSQPDTPLPLTENSSLEDVRARMIGSSRLWKSIWLDAVMIRYGPAGYIGPAQVYRNQLWVQQPHQQIVLSGLPNKQPDTVTMSLYQNIYQMDLKTGQTYYQRADGKGDQLLVGARPAFPEMGDYDPRGLQDGYFLIRMIYPQDFAQAIGKLSALKSETMLERQALIVDAFLNENQPGWVRASGYSRPTGPGTRVRFWLDAQTGVILRLERFDPENPWIVEEEILVKQIVFGAVFPEQSYSSYFFSPDRFVWNNEWLPPEAKGSTSADIGSIPPDRYFQALGPIDSQLLAPTAPTPSDPSHSRLTFQWSFHWLGRAESSRDSDLLVPGNIALIFAGRDYLGGVEMGNAWDLACRRSPDGQSIAYSEGLSDPFATVEKLAYLNLDHVSQPVPALPSGSKFGSDFAFSPDSRSLAFWGCSRGDQDCGVYIKDLETQAFRRISPMEAGSAAYFTWSPNGALLEYITADNPTGSASRYYRFVVRASSGEVIYQSPFRWGAYFNSADSPTSAWGDAFPPPRTGIEACIRPPSGKP